MLESIETLKKRNGKRYSAAVKTVREKLPEVESALLPDEALEFLVSLPKAKFDESVELSIRLGVDPTQADQMVRGAIALPNGLGKQATVVVIAKGEKAREAEAVGADHVGAEDMVEKIMGGWQEFSSVVATPDVMGIVSKLGRVLGPRGLMPNPKVGTVTMDVTKAVSELKKGRVEFRVEKAGIIQVPIGKVSFGGTKLAENFHALMEAVMRAKPASTKGHYILSMFVSPSMGPSVRINHQQYLTI